MREIPVLKSARDAARTSPTATRADQGPAGISGCCQAVLSYFALSADDPGLAQPCAAARGELRIVELVRDADTLAMRFLLPMSYGTGDMMIDTIGSPTISLPGTRLSPAIAAATVGQPVGRLTGHGAFDALDHLLVTNVEERFDEHGRCTTLLHFVDHAAPAARAGHHPASRRLQ